MYHYEGKIKKEASLLKNLYILFLSLVFITLFILSLKAPIIASLNTNSSTIGATTQVKISINTIEVELNNDSIFA